MALLTNTISHAEIQLPDLNQDYFWITSEEQYIYDLLLNWVQNEAPWQTLARFQSLILEGKRDTDHVAADTLQRLINHDQGEQRFTTCIHQCCLILVRHWQMHPQYADAILKLVTALERVSISGTHYHYKPRATRRLQRFVRQYAQSEQGQTWKQLAIAINDHTGEADKPLGLLIQRYPFLYRHYLLGADSTFSHQQYITQRHIEAEEAADLNLSRYVLYLVRKVQKQQECLALSEGPNCGVDLLPLANPTLMSDRAIALILRQFVTKRNRGQTCQDLAKQFRTYADSGISYGAFKEALYEYLATATASNAGKQQFNELLHRQIQQIAPQHDSQPLSEFLLTRTCNQLLSFLIMQNSQHSEHHVLVELLNHLGPLTLGELLLKLVLLCSQVRITLERKLALIFKQYEAVPMTEVVSIVQLFEVINMAFSVSYGDVDVAYAF